MNKKLISITMTIFLFVISCGVFKSDTSVTSSNFPMKERWSSKFDGAVYKLGVADDWIAVGQSKSITAIDSESGKAMWTMDITLDSDSLLLISDDSLIAASSSQLFVINKAGEKIHTINLRPSQSTEIVAMYADYIFVFRRAGGVLEAYSIQNETLAWKITTHRGGVSVNFDPNTNTVFITSSVFVSANNITDGTEIWKINTVARTGILDLGDFYYYSESSQDLGHITALNSFDATKLWNIDVPLKIRTAIYDLTIIDNLLVANTNFGLIALDKNDGNELWQSETNDFFYGKPVLINNTIYVRGTTVSVIFAIDPQNGHYLGYLYLGKPGLLYTAQREYDLVYKSGEFLIFPYENTVYAYH